MCRQPAGANQTDPARQEAGRKDQSGIIWGLSATLHGRIDFKNGAAVQESFTDFEVVRMNESPEIETYMVPSEHSPGGFGETAVPPIAPAVGNAIGAGTNRVAFNP